jgi:hypothetical protein
VKTYVLRNSIGTLVRTKLVCGAGGVVRHVCVCVGCLGGGEAELL